MTIITPSTPVAIIGAGPVGLAAAAHLAERNLPFIVLEAGPVAGHSVLRWGHVQLFSPWRYCLDQAARRLLEQTGWQAPDPEGYPSGRALVERYLAPLAAHPAIAPRLHTGQRVVAVTRAGLDKLSDAGRAQAPFLLQIERADGGEELLRAGAVIDASGTYATPNPLGASGLPAVGELAAADQIFYGIPDVLGAHRERYAGRRVLVAGSGHSAFNALLDLVALAREAPGTQITWVVRRGDERLAQAYGGGANDALPARGALGQRIRALVEDGTVRLVTGWRSERVERTPAGLVVHAGTRALDPVDEIVVTTGLRPDLRLLAELRLGLDPAVEAPSALAPLIDPNLHSCGTVRPHGVDELSHPEPGLYLVGMKSYGRAPTFLLLTGYEQVRSVAAALAGDWVAARRVELELPETGVCSGPVAAGGASAAGCCGPSGPELPARSALVPLALNPAAPAPVTAPGCCTPAEQASCCEPAAKAECCDATLLSEAGTSGTRTTAEPISTSCGCR
ncbi:MAG: FAD-dependent oxidoreductase [Chloroflexi bacterium OHK40]